MLFTWTLLLTIFALCTASFILVYLLYRRFPVGAIYRSKISLEDTFDSFDDPLAIVSQHYRLLRVNKAYCRLVNMPFGKVLHQHCYAILRHRTTPCEDCQLAMTIESAQTQYIEQSPHPSHTTRGRLSFTFFPYRPRTPASEVNVVEHFRDISALALLQQDLKAQNRALEKTGQELKRAHSAFREEIRLAREVQQGILPAQAPHFPGLEIAVSYHPIEEVGGDLYDFIQFPSGELGIFIGDASGHGLSAAFVSMLSKMTLFHHTKTVMEPRELLRQLNADLCGNIHSGHYLTCCWVLFDPATLQLKVARAGHPRPVVVRKDGSVAEIDSTGTFLGMLANIDFEQSVFSCTAADRIYLFTDGIYMTRTEPEKPIKRLNSTQFKHLLARCNSVPLKECIPTIERELAAYVCEDDYTIIVLEVTGAPTAIR